MDARFWWPYLTAVAVGAIAFIVQKKLAAVPGFQWLDRRVRPILAPRSWSFTWGEGLVYWVALAAFFAAVAVWR